MSDTPNSVNTVLLGQLSDSIAVRTFEGFPIEIHYFNKTPIDIRTYRFHGPLND